MTKTKTDVVEHLVKLNKKKITKVDIKNAAKEFNISYSTAERSWLNFVETGVIDRRQTKGGAHMATKKQKEQMKEYMLKARPVLKSKTSPKKMRRVLKKYFEGAPVYALLKKENISTTEFYGAIRTLSVTGKVGRKKILDVTKYTKADLTEVARYSRGTLKDIPLEKKLHYERLLTVLRDYL